MAAHLDGSYQIAGRLERLPLSRWHDQIRTIVAFAWFFDAFDALAIAYVLPVLVPLWHIRPAEIGGLISIGYAGQALGSLLFGLAAQRFGRVPAAVAALILFSLTSLACAFAWSYPSLFWIRFIQGFGLGGEVPVITTYLNEFAKAERRARFVILFQLSFPIGLLAASVAGLLVVPTIGWQWMFIIGAFPALVAIPLWRRLPESPRWLASRGRYEDADRVLSGIEAVVSQNGAKPLPPVPIGLPPAAKEATRILDLFRGIYAKRTVSLWLLWACTYLVVYSLIGWLPTIWRSVYHLSVHDALLYGFIGATTGLAATAVTAFVLDWTGRKAWFGAALILTALPMLPLWRAGAMTAPVVLIWVCISLFWVNTVAVGLGTFTCENYPTHLRAPGSGVAGVCQRAASMIGPLLVGLILPAWGLGAVFVMFAIVAVIGGVSCLLLATETKGLTLEQLSPTASGLPMTAGLAPDGSRATPNP